CRLAVEMLEDRVLPSLTLFVNQDDQYDVAGQTVSVGLYCWSVPGDSVTFSAHGLPPGLSIDSSNGTISGTINYGAEASSPFAATFTARDATAGVCDSAQFLFFIAAPEVTIQSLGYMSSNAGAAINVAVPAWSTDNASLSYIANGLPNGLGINSGTGIISGTIATGAGTSSPYTVTVWATNAAANLTASTTFIWDVGPLELDNPGDQVSYIGDMVNIGLTPFYAGAGTLTFSARGLPAGLDINTQTGIISGTIRNDAA